MPASPELRTWIKPLKKPQGLNLPLYMLEERRERSSSPACWQSDALFKDLPALKLLNLSCVGCLLAFGAILLPVLLQSSRAAGKLRLLHGFQQDRRSLTAKAVQLWAARREEKHSLKKTVSCCSLLSKPLSVFLLQKINPPMLAKWESKCTPASSWGDFSVRGTCSPVLGLTALSLAAACKLSALLGCAASARAPACDDCSGSS